MDLSSIKGNLHQFDNGQGPFDRNGDVKEGYLFRFNLEGLNKIYLAQKETSWPEFMDDLFDGLQPIQGYWVFQGNPKRYDAIGALQAGVVQSWRVSAHKNKISPGDKFILWITGENAGIYALGTVQSNVDKMRNTEEELIYFISPTDNEPSERCQVSIDSNLVDNPILKNEIEGNPKLTGLKAGTQGTTFSATKEQYDEILRIAHGRTRHRVYSIQELSNDTGFNMDELKQWVRAIERKGQAILYGPPGTGKTYLAQRLAKHLIGGGAGFFEIVQFHPTYAYEDFIQGIRPKIGRGGQLEYPMVPGRFLEFCKKAAPIEDKCILIIDEINRANLSRVFGELMYLLEYRDQQVPLAGGGFLKVPANVRIIGTMNTADRSIALVDHALRRRFAFIGLYPNYHILRQYHENNDFNVDTLIDILKRLNSQIDDRNYEVGISFFLQKPLTDKIEDIWRMEIEPYIEEYFFDQPEKVDSFRWDKIFTKFDK